MARPAANASPECKDLHDANIGSRMITIACVIGETHPGCEPLTDDEDRPIALVELEYDGVD